VFPAINPRYELPGLGVGLLDMDHHLIRWATKAAQYLAPWRHKHARARVQGCVRNCIVGRAYLYICPASDGLCVCPSTTLKATCSHMQQRFVLQVDPPQ
jgi:hypothetical protein